MGHIIIYIFYTNCFIKGRTNTCWKKSIEISKIFVRVAGGNAEKFKN